MRDDACCVSLEKGAHRYVFQYSEGRESDLLAAFVELALSEDMDFDWFDAAVLSYQMGRQVERQAQAVA
jgi:hypothetical protein